EIDILKEPIGKQDQYIAAFGGVTCLELKTDGSITATPLAISEETLLNLEDNLLLFFTVYSRSASQILKEQDDKSRQADEEMTQNLHFTKEIAFSTKLALEKGDVSEFARLMNVHWQHKKHRNTGITNRKIDELHDYALSNGALGGKLVGAGGGGVLMFSAKDKVRLLHAIHEQGLREMRFRFDYEATRFVYHVASILG